MNRNGLTLATTLALLLIGSGCSTIHHSGAAALQGTWNGREPGIVPETPRVMVISGNQIEYRGAEANDWGKGTFTVQEDTQPKQLMITVSECGIPQYVGKTCCVIYKIEKGTFTAALNEPGNPVAPASFDSSNARHMVFTKQ